MKSSRFSGKMVRSTLLQLPPELPFGKIDCFRESVCINIVFPKILRLLILKLKKLFQRHFSSYKIASECDLQCLKFLTKSGVPGGVCEFKKLQKIDFCNGAKHSSLTFSRAALRENLLLPRVCMCKHRFS